VTTDAGWIKLDGAVNVRDLGGLPTVDGQPTQAHRLIRSDNLQGLSEADVRLLVDRYDVRAVADLRTGVEVDGEGPGPITHESLVRVENFSLFPEAGRVTDVTAIDDAPVLLPWEGREASPGQVRGPVGVYLRYLEERPDSVVDTLRLIAGTEGATIVHCAAGKDRTGVVIALALAEVGVQRAAIVADFARSAERIEQILGRLAASRTYVHDIDLSQAWKHTPRPETMEKLFDELNERFGGPSAWLRAHGWTDQDAAALRRHLLSA
jgi:protein tyrosine/serine phosphatase